MIGNGNNLPVSVIADLERRRNISRNAGLIFASLRTNEKLMADSNTNIAKLRNIAVNEAIDLENAIQEKLKDK
jgi:hypothetical protein